jgi:hypothetical protein
MEAGDQASTPHSPCFGIFPHAGTEHGGCARIHLIAGNLKVSANKGRRIYHRVAAPVLPSGMAPNGCNAGKYDAPRLDPNDAPARNNLETARRARETQ